MSKRKSEEPPESSSALVVKKQRTSDALIAIESTRTSNLMAPTVVLEGHQADINTLKFSPDGQSLASAGADKQIFLWDVWGECTNYGVLKGHKNAILELFWSSDSKQLFTASADKTGAVWNVEREKIVRRMSEHTSCVSSICPSRTSETSVTCSDDGTARVWDLRTRASTITLNHPYPLTAVCFDEEGHHVFSGGIDNLIHCWDIRKPNTELFRLLSHRDTITSIRLDPFGSYILSNSMDQDLRVWDIRPFAPMQRCIKLFQGAQHNFEQRLLHCNWSNNGELVASGSSDRMVYIWDTTSRNIKYKLPGHKGTVTEVAFHPEEPIIASCGSDKKIFIGEIEKSII